MNTTVMTHRILFISDESSPTIRITNRTLLMRCSFSFNKCILFYKIRWNDKTFGQIYIYITFVVSAP